jgi:transketolase
MPNLALWRPCDAVETAIAWKAAIERSRGPTCLVLTRQALAQQSRTEQQQADIARGGYVLVDSAGPLEAIVIATGSEVAIAADAVRALQAKGRRVRLVSMPSTDTFDAQPESYREQVLPPAVTRRVAIEAGATQSWWRYVGLQGKVLGIDQFGASGKAPELYRHFGLTADNVTGSVERLFGE